MSTTPQGTIWWDFDGTLVSRPLMWTEVGLRVLDRHNPRHGVSASALDAALSTGMPWHRPDHAHPELTTADLWWNEVARRYADVFAAFGCHSAITSDMLAAIRGDILDASRYTVFEDVVPALTRATNDGWRNMIVSNHVPELAVIVAGLNLDPFFHTIITSGIVGYEKPHRELFTEALRHVIHGKPVWMIGDNVDADCRPVCSLGMNAILVRNTSTGVFDCEAANLVSALTIIRK